MIDPQFLRHHPEEVREMLLKRGVAFDLDHFLQVDRALRGAKKERDDLAKEKNLLKKEKPKKGKSPPKYTAIKKALREQTKILSDLQSQWDFLYHRLPNRVTLSSSLAPLSQQKVVKESSPDRKPGGSKSYLALGKALNLFSFRQASRLSGPLSVVYHHGGARLLRALQNFMLDLHTEKHGYREVSLPLLVRREVAFSSGHLPKFEGDMFGTQQNSLFLIPTSEVSMTALHRGEILSPKILPRKYVCASPCFRREKGATPDGIFRTWEFQKVELFQLTRPEDSERALSEMIQEASRVLELLELPYRLVRLSCSDLGFSAGCACDLEVFSPAQDRYLEVSTLSNCLDFQARRSKIRFRSTPQKTEFVHTLNGSGLALPRLLMALMENYQTSDGRIEVPEVLKNYLSCDFIGAS